MPKGNRIRRGQVRYDPDEITGHVRRSLAMFTPGLLRRPRRPGLPRPGPDLHPRHAPRRLDPDRADPRQPSPGRGHDGTAGHPRAGQKARRPQGGGRGFSLSRLSRGDGCRYAGRARRRLSRKHPHPAQDGPALLHRQDAEQLAACRSDPADPAGREDRRRPPSPARLLLLQLQAAFRPRPGLHLRPRPSSAVTIATM